MEIIKRDGSVEEFEKQKIEDAILKAMRYGSGVVEEDIAKTVCEQIEERYIKTQ